MSQPANSDVRVSCPRCAKSLRLTAAAYGRRARCPNCKAVLLIADDGSGASLADSPPMAQPPAVRPTPVPPPSVEPSVAQPPAVQTPVMQPPEVQSPTAQPPVMQPPPIPEEPSPGESFRTPVMEQQTIDQPEPQATAGTMNLGFFFGLMPRILRLYGKNALHLLGALLLTGLVIFVVGWLPLIGQIAALVLTAIVILGYSKFAMNLVDGRSVEFSDLFAYKREWLMATLAHLIVVVTLLIAAGCSFLLSAVIKFIFSELSGADTSAGPGGFAFVMTVFLMVISFTLCCVAFAFWPLFVVDQGRKPIDAVFDSAKLFFKNFRGMITLVLILMGAIFVFDGGVMLLSIIGVQVMGGAALFLAFFVIGLFHFAMAPVPVLIVSTVFRHLVGASRTPDLPAAEQAAA